MAADGACRNSPRLVESEIASVVVGRYWKRTLQRAELCGLRYAQSLSDGVYVTSESRGFGFE